MACSLFLTGKYIRDRVIYEVDGRLALCYKQKIVRAAAWSRQTTVCISTLNKSKVISAVKYKGIPIVQDWSLTYKQANKSKSSVRKMVMSTPVLSWIPSSSCQLWLAGVVPSLVMNGKLQNQMRQLDEKVSAFAKNLLRCLWCTTSNRVYVKWRRS